MLKLDLHVHSSYSWDGFISISKLAKLTKQSGLHGFALTDHGTIKGHKEAKSLAKKEKIIIIPSIEIMTSKGDVLGLGVNELIKKDLSPEEAIDKIRAQGGIAIIPHPYPFFIHPSGLKSLTKTIDSDAIEVLNGRNLIGNNRALRTAMERNLPKTAGSDAHLIEEFGRIYTEVEAEPDIDSILNAIKKGRTKVFGNTNRIISLIKFSLLLAGRRLSYGLPALPVI